MANVIGTFLQLRVAKVPENNLPISIPGCNPIQKLIPSHLSKNEPKH
jgi:hypothetical protein